MTEEVDNRAKYLHGLPKKTKLSFDQRIRRVSAILREQIKTPHPVRVRTVKVTKELKKMNALGYCYLANAANPQRDQYFVIVIPRCTKPDDVVELLVHEWAHAVSWYTAGSTDHGPGWGKAYSELYRLIIDD